ncbi:hypothetical protein KIK06_12795 [Nocardiopsis sp. EMB25]|uniref:hypothetical protein n=1 Tax=Nocardiopsis TaxID=2013 RepID=UPI00034838F0|nr:MULTISPECIES: hypothetical protein [Nocardiopsis]MCY9784768.1 hypothetical protein [Nocardiopsis sp. EMB25]
MTQRRGNGLLADAYVPLVLLAPSHADRMLEALRRSGIAAYAVPLEEDVLEPGGGGETEDPPTDHLYVDAEERAAAERVLGSELPDLGGRTGTAPTAGALDTPRGGDLLDGPPTHGDPDAPPVEPPNEDEVWSDLVARFYEGEGDTAAARRRAAWPDAENLSVPDERDEPPLGDLLADGPPFDRGDALAREAAEEEARRRVEADREGHYEPPPPPPLLQGDRAGIAAWFGLLGGPTVLFGAAFVGITLPNWLMFVAIAAFLVSFVVLILRMTDSRPGGDGPDDGAVV